jgi:hypothetical protein
MNDWNLWLNSSETRTALDLLRRTVRLLEQNITDGSHIQEKSTEKIALDFTYSLGQLDGMRTLIDIILDIEEEIESGD